MLTLVATLLLAQPAAVDLCTRDAECIITTLQCCPTCCGPVPYATTRPALEQKKSRCAVGECAGKPEACPTCEAPPPPEAWVAKCVNKVCVARLKR